MRSWRARSIGLTGLALTLLALTLTAAVVMAVGFNLDADLWRAPLTRALSQAMGREVRIEGDASLRLYWRPELQLNRVRVLDPESDPAGGTAPTPTSTPEDRAAAVTDRASTAASATQDAATGPHTAHIGHMRLSVALAPLLLHRQVRVVRIELRDGDIQLRTLRNGQGNWALPAAQPQAATAAQTPPVFDIVIEQLQVRNVRLSYTAADGTQRTAFIAELDGSAAAGAAVDLHLHGHLDLPSPSQSQSQSQSRSTSYASAYAVTPSPSPSLSPSLSPSPSPSPTLAPAEALATLPFSMALQGDALGALLRPSSAPWPMRLQLNMAGAAMSLQGAIALHAADGPNGAWTVQAQADDAAALGGLLGRAGPPLGAAKLAAQLRWSPQHIELQGLDATVGRTTLHGDLAWDVSGTRPRLSGALTAPTLDLQPLLDGNSGSNSGSNPASNPVSNDSDLQPPRSLLDTWAELERQTLDLHALRLIDADLALQVDRWLSLPGDARDARLHIRLQDGLLEAPVSMTLADVALSGQMRIDGRSTPAAVALSLQARDAPLRALAQVLAHIDGVEGRLQQFDLDVQAQGRTVGEAARAMALRIALEGGRLSYGNVAGGRPVYVTLTRFALIVPGNGPLAGHLNGTWLGEPFHAAFSGGDLAALSRAPHWPVTLTAQASGAELNVSGSIDPGGSFNAATATAGAAVARSSATSSGRSSAPSATTPAAPSATPSATPSSTSLPAPSAVESETAAAATLAATSAATSESTSAARSLGEPAAVASGQGSDLRFTLAAGRAGPVARWLGLAPGADAPVLLTARVVGDGHRLHLRDLIFVLGRSQINGEVLHEGIGGASALTTVNVEVPRLDEDELRTLLPAPAEPGTLPQPARATLDIPVLPARIALADTNLQVRLARLLLGNTEISDVQFAGQVRRGRMRDAPFAARVAGTRFTGTATLDVNGPLPALALALQASQVDVGAMLARMNIVREVEAQVDTLQLALSGQGSRLGELLAQADVRAELKGGRWVLRDPSNTPRLSFALKSGTLTAAPGQPVELDMQAAIDEVPVHMRISSGRLVDFAAVGGELPFALSAEAAQARLDLTGKLTLPISRSRGEGVVAMTASGPRLDSLSALAHADLPPWGPWSLSGRFVAQPQGFGMPDLQLALGSSTLSGQGGLNFGADPPQVTLALNAPSIQLEDFRLDAAAEARAASRAPSTPSAPIQPTASAAEVIGGRAREAARTGQSLLSHAVLNRQDVALSVTVQQVISGPDRLGSGSLKATLKRGRLEIDPVQVQVEVKAQEQEQEQTQTQAQARPAKQPPAGSAQARLSFEPLAGSNDVRLSTRIQVDQFDYAVLARRVKPDSDLKGRFSLDLEFAGTAPLEAMLRQGSGTLAVDVWPVRLDASAYDLWAINLFAAILPTLDRADASTVNCARGRFVLADGLLQQQALVIDTSKVRVRGTARVDFNRGRLHMRLEPAPKSPQFFNLATPIDIEGPLEKPVFSVSSGSAVQSAGRFIGSVVLTPLQMLGGRSAPRDGADLCALDQWRY